MDMKTAQKSDRLGKEKITSLLFKLSLPSIIGMLTQALYNIIDSIFVGRLSTEALSALSLSFPIQMILISLGVGTGVGASSLISRLLGEGNKKRASNAAEHVFFIAIFYGIIVGIFGFFASDKIIQLFTNDLELINLAEQYIRVIMIGSIAIFLPSIFNYILRGEGNTFMPMLTMVIGGVINIILDPFLIFGLGPFPRLGIQGAAIATITARLIGGIFITFILFSDKNELKLKIKEFVFDWEIVKEIYQVGLPAVVNRLIFSVAVMFINKLLGTFNATAVAVMGVIFRLQSFFLMAVFGLNQGYLPLVGYNFGYNKPDRLKRTVLLGWGTALTFGTIGFIVFQFFPEFMLSLFNDDPKLLNIGIPALKRVSLSYFFMVLNIIGVATFQAIGQGLPSLIITILRQAIFLVPGMYLIGNFVGLNASWFAFPIAESLAFIIMSTWLYRNLKLSMAEMKGLN
ncbi:MAG: MATE family efflux transporter [Bacillota bacterium]